MTNSIIDNSESALILLISVNHEHDMEFNAFVCVFLSKIELTCIDIDGYATIGAILE